MPPVVDDDLDLSLIEDDQGDQGTPGSGLSEQLKAMIDDVSDKPTVEEILSKYTPEQIAQGFMRQARFTKKTQRLSELADELETARKAREEQLSTKEQELTEREQKLAEADGQLLNFLREEAEKDPNLTLADILQVNHQEKDTMPRPTDDIDLELIEDEAARDAVKRVLDDNKRLAAENRTVLDRVTNLEREFQASDVTSVTRPALDARPDLFPSIQSDDPKARQLRIQQERALATHLKVSGALDGKVSPETAVQDWIQQQDEMFKFSLQSRVDIKRKKQQDTPRLEGPGGSRVVVDKSKLEGIEPGTDQWLNALEDQYAAIADDTLVD